PSTLGAGWADQRGLARDGEQPPREVLQPHTARTRSTQARDPGLGSSNTSHCPDSQGVARRMVIAVRRRVGAELGILPRGGPGDWTVETAAMTGCRNRW